MSTKIKMQSEDVSKDNFSISIEGVKGDRLTIGTNVATHLRAKYGALAVIGIDNYDNRLEETAYLAFHRAGLLELRRIVDAILGAQPIVAVDDPAHSLGKSPSTT